MQCMGSAFVVTPTSLQLHDMAVRRARRPNGRTLVKAPRAFLTLRLAGVNR